MFLRWWITVPDRDKPDNFISLPVDSTLVGTEEEDWANPTVRGIHQWSKQSFQTHHPGSVGDNRPRYFFFNKFIGKMLYFSVNKGIIHSHRDLNSVSSFTDKTNLLGPMPSRLRSPAPRVCT